MFVHAEAVNTIVSVECDECGILLTVRRNLINHVKSEHVQYTQCTFDTLHWVLWVGGIYLEKHKYSNKPND